MGRPERPIAGDGPVGRFAEDLRELRRQAGNPSYRKMARVAHYSLATLSQAASGTKLPSLAVTLGYVRACDGDVQEWERRWHQVAAETGRSAERPAPEPSGASESDEPPDPDAAPPPGPEQPATQPVAALPQSPGDSPRERRLTRRGAKLLIATGFGTAVATALAAGLIVSAQSGRPPRVLAGPTSTVTVSVSAGASQPSPEPTGTPPAEAPGPGNGKDAGWRGTTRPTSHPGASTPPAAVVTHTLVAGPGCPASSTHTTGTQSDGDGWKSVSGGWQSNGCDGISSYTNESGSTSTTQDVFTWSFRVSSAAATAHCRFAIFVPDTFRSKGLAPYLVYAGNTHLADFSFDQSSRRGGWFSSPTYTFTGGAIQLELADHGPDHASVTASAVISHCT